VTAKAAAPARPVKTAAGIRADAAPSAPPRADVVRFTCECGKSMQARTEFAGRLARCPACGENVIIPGPTATKRSMQVTPEQPTPAPRQKPARMPRVEEEDEIPEVEEVVDDYEEEEEEEVDRDERPRRRSQNYRRQAKQSGGSRVLIWTCLTLLLLLMLGSTGALAWWMFGSSAATDDLTYVPGDGAALFSLRLADAAATPFGQKAVAMLPPSAKTAMGNEDLSEVERVTIVVADSNPTKFQDSMWVVIRATKRMDKEKVFQGAGDTFKEVKFEDKTYYTPSSPSKPSIWFVSDKIMLFGEPTALKRAMKLPSKRATGPLDAVLDDLQSKQHQIVVAFKRPPSADNSMRGLPPMFANGGQKALDFTLVTMTGDAKDDVSLDLNLLYDSEAKAVDAKTAMVQMLQSFKPMAQMMEFANKGKKDGPKPPSFTAILDSIKPEQIGSRVNLKFTIDSGMLAMFKDMAAMQGPGARPGPPQPIRTFKAGGAGATPTTPATPAPVNARRSPRGRPPVTDKQ
jgi:hypothetical protein